MSSRFTENVVEDAALAWLASLGYTVLHGPDIAIDQPDCERSDPDYDALETNDSAVMELGDDRLRIIARELVETVRNNVTIDWTGRCGRTCGRGCACW